MKTKSVMGRPDVKKVADPASQDALGEALSLTHAAEAITMAAMQEYMDQCQRWQETGEPITATDTLKVWAMARKGCHLACDAVQVLFRSASASSSHKGQKMQRYFRDIQMYLVHPSSQPIVGTLYAQNYLGLGTGIPGIAN